LRGRFTRGNRSFVVGYNETELRSMVELHQSLAITLRAGDCKIRHWFGPGSVARHLANRHGVTVEGVEVDDEGKKRAVGQLAGFLGARRDLATAGLEPAETLAARAASPHACVVDAFYGGRFELSQQGPIDRCWEYDLSSAYPWALSCGMPCF